MPIDWEQYYKERPLSLERYINNIWAHKPFLIGVASSGRNILEVATGTGNLDFEKAALRSLPPRITLWFGTGNVILGMSAKTTRSDVKW